MRIERSNRYHLQRGDTLTIVSYAPVLNSVALLLPTQDSISGNPPRDPWCEDERVTIEFDPAMLPVLEELISELRALVPPEAAALPGKPADESVDLA